MPPPSALPPVHATATALLLLALHAAVGSAQTHCREHHQWFDGASCLACNNRGCSTGMYRETCTTASTQDAHCIPCTLPPPNAVHVTGGLPFLEDACMWACRTGYYREGDGCTACNQTVCGAPLVRGPCSQGTSHDAQCVCPVDHYMALPVGHGEGGVACVPCAHPSCDRPEYETLYRCPGHTTEDVSQCMPNVVLMPGTNSTDADGGGAVEAMATPEGGAQEATAASQGEGVPLEFHDDMQAPYEP